MYVVRYACKELVKLLRLPLGELLEIVVAFPHDFLRGFFDAEGHVDVGVSKTFHLAVGVENTDRQLLMKVKHLLAELKIESRIERKRKAGTPMTIRGRSLVTRRTSYSVVIGGLIGVKSFANEIGFSIHRKTLKLRDALSIIETCNPRARPTAWKKSYTKIAGEWVRRRPMRSSPSKSIKRELRGGILTGR